MTRYKVVDPNGIPHGGKTVEKGDTFLELPHSAQVRAWLRFGQIAEVKAKAKADDPDADTKAKAEQEKVAAETKAKEEAAVKAKAAEADAKAK